MTSLCDISMVILILPVLRQRPGNPNLVFEEMDVSFGEISWGGILYLWMVQLWPHDGVSSSHAVAIVHQGAAQDGPTPTLQMVGWTSLLVWSQLKHYNRMGITKRLNILVLYTRAIFNLYHVAHCYRLQIQIQIILLHYNVLHSQTEFDPSYFNPQQLTIPSHQIKFTLTHPPLR